MRIDNNPVIGTSHAGEAAGNKQDGLATLTGNPLRPESDFCLRLFFGGGHFTSRQEKSSFTSAINVMMRTASSQIGNRYERIASTVFLVSLKSQAAFLFLIRELTRLLTAYRCNHCHSKAQRQDCWNADDEPFEEAVCVDQPDGNNRCEHCKERRAAPVLSKCGHQPCCMYRRQ